MNTDVSDWIHFIFYALLLLYEIFLAIIMLYLCYIGFQQIL